MFLFDVEGLFTGPAQLVEQIKDEDLKRQMIQMAVGVAYSSLITFLYTLGKQLEGKRWLGLLAAPLEQTAASIYALLIRQDVQKVVVTAVPQEFATGPLPQGIYFLEVKSK